MPPSSLFLFFAIRVVSLHALSEREFNLSAETQACHPSVSSYTPFRIEVWLSWYGWTIFEYSIFTISTFTLRQARLRGKEKEISQSSDRVTHEGEGAESQLTLRATRLSPSLRSGAVLCALQLDPSLEPRTGRLALWKSLHRRVLLGVRADDLGLVRKRGERIVETGTDKVDEGPALVLVLRRRRGDDAVDLWEETGVGQ